MIGELAAHIFIPLIIGLAFMVLSYATGPAITWSQVAAETGLDLAILSIGATGAVFENARLIQMFKNDGNAMLAGIGVMALNLLFSAFVIVLRKRIYETKPGTGHPRSCGFLALLCGALTVVSISTIVVAAYRVRAVTAAPIH